LNIQRARRRRIAVVTGSPAEYGLLCPLLTLIQADPSLTLQLIVSGSHLNAAHGLTVSAIKSDGFPIAAKVPMPLQDSPLGVAAAMAAGLTGFARAFSRLKPDILVVLGDRYEILAAAAAALPFGLPVAHLHGGETTEGAWDEQIRHAVTKLSHLHFCAAEPYARRLRRLGEDPRRVFCFGSPGLDRIRCVARLSREELERQLGLTLRHPLVLVTYQPETLEASGGLRGFEAVLKALARSGATCVFNYPNADLGRNALVARLKAHLRAHPGRAKAFPSLGSSRYLSLMAQADAMVGNSSSGLLEAPYFCLPAVNVGDRQKSRLRSANVIDVPRPSAASVGRALRRALSPAFRRRLGVPASSRGTSPARRIVQILKTTPLENLTHKHFYDR
jgi:UDP-N-acetylglucosamine 2-epimerase (non-hydrolysing)/GDP/UDP-N,N'-diacetylbacillosamine 2-epimerase (hydrolysing)